MARKHALYLAMPARQSAPMAFKDMEECAMCRRSLAVALSVFALLAFAGPGAGGEPPTRRSAGQWTFDGDLLDRVGRGNDVIFEAATYEQSPGGQALRMGRTPARILDSPDLRLAPGFRLECRVRFAALPSGNAWATVAMKGDYSRGEYVLRVNPAAEGGDFGFFVNLGGWEPRVRSGRKVETGVWYHVLAGWDGTDVWLTVNGQTTRVPRTGVPATGNTPLCLGPFDGHLDDMRIDNPNARPTGVVASWSFDGDLRDASGRGHDIAATGREFAPGRGGKALRTVGAELPVSTSGDFQVAPGFRLTCDVFLRSVPADGAMIVRKEGEYQLRVDPAAEGGCLAFFVKVGGWEPRIRGMRRMQAGVWYRVTAGWDGQVLTLDVNGESSRVNRSGFAKPGAAPLTIGAFDGLLANLRVENPKLPVIFVAEWRQENSLLRAERIEPITAVIRNCGSEARRCVVGLGLPSSVVLEGEGSGTHDLGALPTGAERVLTWAVRAAAPTTAAATLRVTGEGFAPVTSGRTLAFLPARDPVVVAAGGGRAAPGAGATAYYVDSAQGSNANVGTSPESPWRDFTNINGKILGPGERLLIKRGSVINQQLDIAAAGRVDAWAEIGAYGSGPRPVIRRNWHIDDRCMLVRSPDYLRISGLVVCFAGKGLVVAYAEAGHRGLVIEDCIAHHIEGLYRFNSHGIPEWRDRRGPDGDMGLRSSAGIAVVGAPAEDLAVRDCEMFQCSWGFFVKGDGVTIDRVFCHDNHAFNTSPHPALVGIRRSYLRNSIFDAPGWHAHAGTMGIMLVDCHGLIIRNCFFLNQPDSGSHDEGGIDFEAHGNGCLIEGCTFRNNAGAAIEVLGLKSPQAKGIDVFSSRFFRNNTARKLGPAEIYIWGKAPNPDVCCSTGVIRNNGYVLNPGVSFFTNEAPKTTRWTLQNNTEYPSDEALKQAMPFNEPPGVNAGPDVWTDQPTAHLAGSVGDDGKPSSGRVKITWEVLHGPGPVTFQDGAAAATVATFAAPGDYLLRLVADDGELWRSDVAAVHVLPSGAAVAKAWDFNTPLEKEGWTEVNPGTQVQEWEDCRSHPVKYVAGGHYIVAIENSTDAHLLSADNLNLDCARNRIVTVCFQNRTPATRMRVRFTTDANPDWAGARGQDFAVVANDDAPRAYNIDMAAAPGWEGRLKQLRLDLATGAPLTGTCRIDYVWVGDLPRK